MAKYFNSEIAISMVPDCNMSVVTLSAEQALQWLAKPWEIENVANPAHVNTLAALEQRFNLKLQPAKGGKVEMKPGDEVLVVQINGLPRETREFTDEEVAKATFEFRLVIVNMPTPKGVRVEYHEESISIQGLIPTVDGIRWASVAAFGKLEGPGNGHPSMLIWGSTVLNREYLVPEWVAKAWLSRKKGSADELRTYLQSEVDTNEAIKKATSK